MRNTKGKSQRRQSLTVETLEPRMMLAVDIDVQPFDHHQTWLGGGAGYTLYGGHVVSMTEANQEQVYDWLFKDLNQPYLRIFSFRGEAAGNDNADPFDFDIEAMDISLWPSGNRIYNEAVERNPNTKIMAYANSHPDFLKNPDGTHNLDFPNFHEELAEWLYANLVATKERHNTQIDIIDILNEPDLSSTIDRDTAAAIIAGTIPALQNLVDANFAQYGIAMPQISAPSNLTTGGAANWLEDWKANFPDAYSQIDILSTHPYQGEYSVTNYKRLVALRDADHPLVIQNEMEFGHSSFVNDGDLPDDNLDDDLEGALALSRALAIAVDTGVDSFQVFQGVNPSTAGAKSLIRTPFGGTPELRKGYFTYRQMTSLQPEFSDVVSNDTTGAPTGFHTVAFNHWEDNKVYVNVVNATGAAESTTLSFTGNSGSPISFTRVLDYATDAVNDMTVIGDHDFVTPATEWTTTVEAHSVRTFVVDLTQAAYAVPVGDLTYVRERNDGAFQTTAWDDDINPRTEFLVGYNGAGAAGSGRGIMRGFAEFDLAAFNLPDAADIQSASLELRGYRGNLDSNAAIGFELRELGSDFVESQASWVDPDGDGNPATGDTTLGGTLGSVLASSQVFSGANQDFNANGTSEIFHQRVTIGNTSALASAVDIARDGSLRLAIDPISSATPETDFFGFFDEQSPYAPYLVVTTTADATAPEVTSFSYDGGGDHRVELQFSEPIDPAMVTADDFVVLNKSTFVPLATSEVIIEQATPTSVTLGFLSGRLEDANWSVRVNEAAVTDGFGNPNPQSEEFEFYVLAGDANRDRTVSAADYALFRDTVGSTTKLAANYDNTSASQGIVDQADHGAWVRSFGVTLDEGTPQLALAPESITSAAFAWLATEQSAVEPGEDLALPSPTDEAFDAALLDLNLATTTDLGDLPASGTERPSEVGSSQVRESDTERHEAAGSLSVRLRQL